MIKLLNGGMQHLTQSRENILSLNQGRANFRQIPSRVETIDSSIQNELQSMFTKSGRINWNLKYSFYNAQGRRTSSIFSAKTNSSQDIRLGLPVKGRVIISSEYGEDRGNYIHKGIDFDGNKGDGIFSAAGGKVIYVGYTESGGNEVIIQHSESLMTRYAHLDEVFVKEGQVVQAGEQIGTMGNTGTVYYLTEETGVTYTLKL